MAAAIIVTAAAGTGGACKIASADGMRTQREAAEQRAQWHEQQADYQDGRHHAESAVAVNVPVQPDREQTGRHALVRVILLQGTCPSSITRHVWRMHLLSTSVAERGSVSMHSAPLRRPPPRG